MPQELTQLADVTLSIQQLLTNMGIGCLLSILLAWQFQKFGASLSNRREMAAVFPMVTLTTILIISVVKSSLALSLGLVGALSIVRFRTPIKEPEELGYLFITIAIGLGLGANQTFPTVVAVLSIMVVMTLLRLHRLRLSNKHIHLTIDWHEINAKTTERHLEKLNDIVFRHIAYGDLRRFDIHEETLEAVYIVDVESTAKISELSDDLRQSLGNVAVSFLDHSQIPTV